MGIKQAMNAQITANLASDEEVTFFEALIVLDGVCNIYLSDTDNQENLKAFLKEFDKVELLYKETFEESDTYKAFMKAKYEGIKAIYDAA